MPLMHKVRVEPAGFPRRNPGIGCQPLVRLGQVDEAVDADSQQGSEPTGSFLATPRVRTLPRRHALVG